MRWPKTLLVVSHAREFLNAVCTDTIHLHSRRLTPYRGAYDVFEKSAAERLRNQRKAAEAVQHKRQHMQVAPLMLPSPTNPADSAQGCGTGQ